jgi:hypothetical protein
MILHPPPPTAPNYFLFADRMLSGVRRLTARRFPGVWINGNPAAHRANQLRYPETIRLLPDRRDSGLGRHGLAIHESGPL